MLGRNWSILPGNDLKNFFMKKNILAAIYSVLILFITGCYKKENKHDPNPWLVSVRVVEFGSGLPIAGVDFSYQFCAHVADFGCAEYRDGSAVTNTDGLITIPPEAIGHYPFSSYTFAKNEYWVNADGDFLFLPYGSDWPPIDYANGRWQVKLFPKVNISIHAKNIIVTPLETTFYLQCQGQCCPGFSGRDGNPVSLGRGTDTTFDYPVFGNVENDLYVVKSNSATDTVFAHSQFIAKGDSVSIEVLY